MRYLLITFLLVCTSFLFIGCDDGKVSNINGSINNSLSSNTEKNKNENENNLGGLYLFHLGMTIEEVSVITSYSIHYTKLYESRFGLMIRS